VESFAPVRELDWLGGISGIGAGGVSSSVEQPASVITNQSSIKAHPRDIQASIAILSRTEFIPFLVEETESIPSYKLFSPASERFPHRPELPWLRSLQS
jgi:hypothetical protein